MIFLGYESGTKGYRFLWSNKLIYVATAVTFIENLFPNCSEKKLRNKIGIPEPRHPTEDDNTNQLPPNDLDLPPQDPPQQPDDGHNDGNGNKRDSTKPQSPHQQTPKTEEVDDNDMQNPLGEPHFNIGRTPTPPQPYSPPPYNMPCERHFCTNPQICIPPVQPDNVYGHRHPVDIEREIQQEREWMRQVLKGNAPTIPEAVPEQDELDIFHRKYLSTSLELALYFSRGESILNAYCDSDWAGDLETRHSTSDYAIFLGKDLISWHSHHQATITLSSTEAEYMSMCNCAQQILWIQSIFHKCHLTLDHSIMFGDNKGALHLAQNPVIEGRSKHINIKYYFLQECVENKSFLLDYVPTNQQEVDLMTKNLTV